MNLINHQPTIRLFSNGVQITFNNLYTVVFKLGPGTKTSVQKSIEDVTDIIATRYGGHQSSDVEVEVYDPQKNNITNKFGEDLSLGYVSPIELCNLLFIVSSLQNLVKQ